MTIKTNPVNSWEMNKLSLEKLIDGKRGKITIDPLIAEYYKDIASLFEQHRDLFYKGS